MTSELGQNSLKEKKGMKKRIAMAAITLLTMLSICGCIESGSDLKEDEKATETNVEQNTEEDAEGEDTPEETTTETTQVEQINLENAEGSLVYVRHEVIKDYNGSDAIRI